jgi:hypothetical protein
VKQDDDQLLTESALAHVTLLNLARDIAGLVRYRQALNWLAVNDMLWTDALSTGVLSLILLSSVLLPFTYSTA